jgi:uncharacterized protein YjaZ
MASESIRLHFVNVTGSLGPCEAVVQEAFARATTAAEARLSCGAVDVVVFDAPDECIPELGVGGTTMTPNLVLLAIDPGAPTLERHGVESTLLHEFHHAMRGRTTSLDADLGSMLVTEGLATLFEEEATGSTPIYAQVPCELEDLEPLRAALGDGRVDRGRWFYGGGDLPRAFGYSFGYRLCRRYAHARQVSAAELVDVAALDVLATLEHVLYRDGRLPSDF